MYTYSPLFVCGVRFIRLAIQFMDFPPITENKIQDFSLKYIQNYFVKIIIQSKVSIPETKIYFRYFGYFWCEVVP